MAIENTATVLGSDTIYRLHPDVKRYTLIDNGFIETKGGNYQLTYPIDTIPQGKKICKLKIIVSKDIQTLKMSITTTNGLKPVNIFKNSKHKIGQEKFYFLMDEMISRGLFEKVVDEKDKSKRV